MSELWENLADKSLASSFKSAELTALKELWVESFGWAPNNIETFRTTYKTSATVGDALCEQAVRRCQESDRKAGPGARK